MYRPSPTAPAAVAPVSVLLIDDHAVVRTGVRRLLETRGVARVVAEAKRRAIGLAEAGYVPPDRNAAISLISTGRGASLLMGAQMFFWGGYASAHDQKIAQKIAHVLAGGMTGQPTASAQQLLDLEREAFCSLAGEAATVARIKHMLETGKPLRN